MSQCLGCSKTSVHQFSHWQRLLHRTTTPSSGLVPQILTLPWHKWVQQTSADYCCGQRIKHRRDDYTWYARKGSRMQKIINLQLRIHRRTCTSSVLWLPALLGPERCIWQDACSIILHYQPLPSYADFFLTGTSSWPNTSIWTDLRKKLNPDTMQDEKLQIPWLFTLFCIQEFSAGMGDLKECFHE